MHFFVTLEGEGGRDGSSSLQGNFHVNEEVGWLASDVGHSSLVAVTFEAGKTPMAVTEVPYPIEFTGFFRSKPEFFAAIGSYHGDDSAQVRQYDTSDDGVDNAITASSATVQIEEEICSGEGAASSNPYGFGHGMAEEVDYFAINKGAGSFADTNDRGRMSASQIIGSGSLSTSGNHKPFAEAGELTLAWSYASNWPNCSVSSSRMSSGSARNWPRSR